MANAWGELSWNAGLWGQQSNAIVPLTGLQLNTSQGQANYTPVDGWGRFDWGSRSWGVNFTNQQIQSGSFPLTLTLGDETATGEVNDGWGRSTWGSGSWGQTGDVLLVGQQINLSLNSVDVAFEVNTGWGRLAWGQNDWGGDGLSISVVPLGQQLNISLNSVTP